jgi:hypothetical protein
MHSNNDGLQYECLNWKYIIQLYSIIIKAAVVLHLTDHGINGITSISITNEVQQLSNPQLRFIEFLEKFNSIEATE